MKYRIVIETTIGGEKYYYVQKRIMWVFWVYVREIRDISMYSYKVFWHSLEKAEDYIQQDINHNFDRRQQKISKREFIYK